MVVQASEKRKKSGQAKLLKYPPVKRNFGRLLVFFGKTDVLALRQPVYIHTAELFLSFQGWWLSKKKLEKNSLSISLSHSPRVLAYVNVCDASLIGIDETVTRLRETRHAHIGESALERKKIIKKDNRDLAIQTRYTQIQETTVIEHEKTLK